MTCGTSCAVNRSGSPSALAFAILLLEDKRDRDFQARATKSSQSTAMIAIVRHAALLGVLFYLGVTSAGSEVQKSARAATPQPAKNAKAPDPIATAPAPHNRRERRPVTDCSSSARS